MSALSCGVWKNALPAVSIDVDSVYDTRVRPHAASRVENATVSPSYHESPIDWYWLMLPNAGIRPAKVGDAEDGRLRRGQRRRIDVARHDDLVAAQPGVPDGDRRRAAERALDLQAELAAAPILDVRIDAGDRGQHVARERRQRVRERPARPPAPNESTAVR